MCGTFRIGTDTAAIFRLSEPLKAQYAKVRGATAEYMKQRLENYKRNASLLFRQCKPTSHAFKHAHPFVQQDHGLDLEKLLSAAAYKEEYRQKMIVWGEQKRNADPGYKRTSSLLFTHF